MSKASRAPRCGSGPNCPLQGPPIPPPQLEDPSLKPQSFPPHLDRTPKGAYSPRERSGHLLETPFSEPLLSTLLRNPFFTVKPIAGPLLRTLLRTLPQNLSRTFSEPFLERCVAVRPLRRAPQPPPGSFCNAPGGGGRSQAVCGGEVLARRGVPPSGAWGQTHIWGYSKAPDPLCSQKVWRKITLVKFKENLRKIKGILKGT